MSQRNDFVCLNLNDPSAVNKCKIVPEKAY